MKRKIDLESLPLKNWKKEAAMFQDDYTAGAGTSWLLNVAKAENKMIWEMIRAIEEAPTLTPPNEWVSVEERLPEQENTQVLMTDGECCYISSRNNMVRFLDCEGIFIPGKAGAGVKVTHWMPLPAPPDRRPPEEEGDQHGDHRL